MGRGRLRVAVLGGGVLGASTAAALSERGADVTLLTRAAVGDGASGRSLSWLNSWGIRAARYSALRLQGLERYRALLADREVDWLRFDGGLTWPRPGEVDYFREAFDHMQRTGYPAEWLTPDEVPSRAPGVDPAAVAREGAVLNPTEGWVELPLLLEHLVARVHDAGGRVVQGAGDATVLVNGDRVAGVRTGDGGEMPVDAAVVATGAEVPSALRRLGVHVPDATVTGLVVQTEPVATRLRMVLNTPRVSVRPAPGGRLALDAGWSEREVEVAVDGRVSVREETVAGLLREAAAVLEGHPELNLHSYGVGPKPIPGDGEPVLGALEQVPGCWVAFTHSGATLGLAVGELLADEIVTGHRAPLLEPFGPQRFAPFPAAAS